jgi:hypothetical protein
MSATDQVLETNEAFAKSFDKDELFLPKTDELRGSRLRREDRPSV